MKLKQFVKEYNDAPYDLETFALAAEEITDCPELSEAAQAFLEAKAFFEDVLSQNDVEIG